MKYARVLLGHCPDKTTDFFIRYYTGKYQQSAPASEEGEHAPQSQVTPENPPAAATETPTPTPPSPQYQIPGPRTAFSLFVDQPNNFVQFLEALVERPHMKEEDRSDVYTTLFEMYLDVAQNTKDPQESEVKKAKARKLIQGDNVSDIPPQNRRERRSTQKTLSPNEVCSRYPYQRPMFCYFPTYQISKKARP